MREWTIELPGLPSSVDELVALRDRLATTPEGGVAILVLALLVWGKDPKLGLQCLTVAIEQAQLSDGPDGYKGKQPSRVVLQNLKDRLAGKPHIIHSLVQGTSPQSGYALPPPPWRLSGREQPGDVRSDKMKTFIRSTGADTPRPVHVVKNDKGLWKANNWSSIEVGVRAPAPPPDDI